MKIAVLEYLCCGGLATESNASASGNPSGTPIHELATEGWLMLDALTRDLFDCGHSVITCLDRHACPNAAFPKGICVESVDFRSGWISKWIELARKCDRSIVIAPELDDILVGAIREMRNHEVRLVAAETEFIASTSDKYLTAQLLRKANIRTPTTWTIDPFLSTVPTNNPLLEWNGPWVLKRRDGAGCSDMWMFQTTHSLRCHLELTNPIPNGIIQPWYAGQAASLALVVQDGVCEAVGAMNQNIQLDQLQLEYGASRVTYTGGDGPLPLQNDDLLQFARRVLESIPGQAQGWIGIDFLIPPHERSPKKDHWEDWVVIEINPRLTTSYLGYRQYYGSQLADAMIGQRGISDIIVPFEKRTVEFSSVNVRQQTSR